MAKTTKPLRKKFSPKKLAGGGEVLTIPDDAYKIRDLLVKFSNGVLPEGYTNKTATFQNGDFDADDLEKVRHQDLSDLSTYMKSNNERIIRLQEQRNRLAKQTKQQNAPDATTNDDE